MKIKPNGNIDTRWLVANCFERDSVAKHYSKQIGSLEVFVDIPSGNRDEWEIHILGMSQRANLATLLNAISAIGNETKINGFDEL